MRIRIRLFSLEAFKMPSFIAYYFLKVPTSVRLHQSSKIKSHKEVTKQLKSRLFFPFLIDDGRITIRSKNHGSGSDRQKLRNPSDPNTDAQHCFLFYLVLIVFYFFILARTFAVTSWRPTFKSCNLSTKLWSRGCPASRLVISCLATARPRKGRISRTKLHRGTWKLAQTPAWTMRNLFSGQFHKFSWIFRIRRT